MIFSIDDIFGRNIDQLDRETPRYVSLKSVKFLDTRLFCCK